MDDATSVLCTECFSHDLLQSIFYVGSDVSPSFDNFLARDKTT